MPNVAAFTESAGGLNRLRLKGQLEVISKKDYRPCYHRRKAATGTCKMETPDVGILYCVDATEWCEHLNSSLRLNFHEMRIISQRLEDLVLPLTLAKMGFFLRIKAQIVIISPNLLEYVQQNPEVILDKLFDPTRVLAFVCGVEESDFQSMHRANLPSFDTWRKIYVTERAVQDCVVDSMRWIAEMFSVDETAESRKKAKAGFKLHPNKVREGASKVIIEMMEAVAEGQSLNVTVETDTESIPLKAVLRNPHMAKFVLPDRFFDVSQIVAITVKCGAKSLGSQSLKCESKMAEMDSLLRTILHPLSFMCQTLGLAESRIEELDHILTNVVKINIPKCGFSVMDLSSHIDRQRVDVELPTLLHFSAKMGLKELSAVLLDCPGGEAACRLRNASGHTPADLAEKEGHSCLAGLLESYSSMSETAEIYIYMQRMTEDVNNKNYENLSTTFRRSLEHGFQYSGFPKHSANDDACTEGACGGETLLSTSYMNTDVQEQLTIRTRLESSKGSNMHLYGQSQRELIQLIEDFKEEKYNIEQVEVLFKSWQQKQYSRSFYEKQKQLKDLREQYEQIQNQCHEKTRKKSALERFRYMLIGNVKKEEISTPVKAKAVYKREKSSESEDMLPDLRMKQRPSSTWSCGSNSSSLSDRSSTMSGTSDSGALSDIGEEKPVYKRKDDDEPKQGTKLSVPMAFENRQYMYSKPLPPLPSKKPSQTAALSSVPLATVSTALKQVPQKAIVPKSALPKSGSPKLVGQQPRLSTIKSVMSSQLSISDRKPMPPPRIYGTLSQELPSVTVSSCPDISREGSNDCHPTAAVPFPQNSKNRKTSLTLMGCSAPESGFPSDGYLLMHNQRPVPGRRPSAPIVVEADYYNQPPGEPTGDYMVMDPASNPEVHASNPSATLSSNCNTHLSSYANVMHVQGNMSESDHDRCDSVPEMMAPPLPTMGMRQGPPPLPRRNLEKFSHEEASAKRN